jgi:hypothetical protein
MEDVPRYVLLRKVVYKRVVGERWWCKPLPYWSLQGWRKEDDVLRKVLQVPQGSMIKVKISSSKDFIETSCLLSCRILSPLVVSFCLGSDTRWYSQTNRR